MITEEGITSFDEFSQLPAVDFFVAGGNLHHDAASYVKRSADDELLDQILARQFCYLLTARQMGKSSLTVRTASRLKEMGISVAIVDLTQIGTNVTAEQWYLGLLKMCSKQLNLEVKLENWWQSYIDLSPVQRFSNFLQEVILVEKVEQVTIFIDEIDTTLNLSFTDDFFAAIRAVYNVRATEKNFERLTFVLVGVATPSDLIKDRTRTPFNIGTAIDLKEFTHQEAAIFGNVLEDIFPNTGLLIIDRIFYWTNGHPYLTQRLCLAVAQSNQNDWNTSKIDELVAELFLSEKARGETNLQFIRDKIATHPQKRLLLVLYRRIYYGKMMRSDERSITQNQLKLIGLIRAEKEILWIRNEIYRQVFDPIWIKNVMPVDRKRTMAVVAVLIVALLLIGLVYTMQQSKRQAEDVLAQQAIDTFNEQRNAALRLNSLSDLFTLTTYSDEARALFVDLSPNEQMALFSRETTDLAEQRGRVVQGVYVILENTDANTRLLTAIESALDDSAFLENQRVANEISQWLLGRDAYIEERYDDAIEAFSNALRENSENPATYFDRGLVYLALSNYEASLQDFNVTLQFSRDEDVLSFWSVRISNIIVINPQLHAVWWQQRSNYDELAQVVPTPTPTATPTSTPTVTWTPSIMPVNTRFPTGLPTGTIEDNTPAITPILTQTIVTGTPPVLPTITPTLPPTNTSAPPTNTSAPPTNTSAPPTNTSAPPTNTSAPPTSTSAPPTSTLPPTRPPTPTPP